MKQRKSALLPNGSKINHKTGNDFPIRTEIGCTRELNRIGALHLTERVVLMRAWGEAQRLGWGTEVRGMGHEGMGVRWKHGSGYKKCNFPPKGHRKTNR